MKCKIDNKFTVRLAIGLLTLCLCACDDEKEFFPNTIQATGTHVKFIHAAVDELTGQTATSIRGVDVYFNNSKVNGTAIAYGTTFPSLDYMVFTPGTTALQVKAPYIAATASLPEVAEKQMVAAELNTAYEKRYTVAILGTNGNFETVVFNDDVQNVPFDGRTYVRLINLIENATTGLILEGTPPKISTADPDPVPVDITGPINYKEASAFIALPVTGTYTNIRVKDAATGTVVATLAAGATSTAQAFQVYTVFARGKAGLPSTDAKRAQLARTSHR